MDFIFYGRIFLYLHVLSKDRAIFIFDLIYESNSELALQTCLTEGDLDIVERLCIPTPMERLLDHETLRMINTTEYVNRKKEITKESSLDFKMDD